MPDTTIRIPLNCSIIGVTANIAQNSCTTTNADKRFRIYLNGVFPLKFRFLDHKGNVATIKRKLGDTSPPMLIIIGEKNANINIKYLLQKNFFIFNLFLYGAFLHNNNQTNYSMSQSPTFLFLHIKLFHALQFAP